MMAETRKSIDDCSGEEWNAAAKGHWDFLKKDRVYEEDPVYSSREDKIIENRRIEDEEDIFGGSLFDEADQGDTDPVYRLIEEEERFEQIVQILGPYYAISYCHGAALDILLDIDNAHNSMSIDVAKVHLSRMARLINETQGVNW